MATEESNRRHAAPPPLISVNDILKAHPWNGRQLESLLVVLGVGLSDDAQKNRRLRAETCGELAASPWLLQLDRPSLGIVASFLSERCRVNYRKAGARSSFGEDGILYGLGTAFGSAPWVNPEQHGMAVITRSTRGSGADCVGHASAFAGRTMAHSHTRNPDHPHDAWYSLELTCHRVRPTHYALMSYGPGGRHFIMNWDLEGSADGVTWTTLRSHTNDRSIHEEGRIETWPLEGVADDGWYCHFRVIGSGPEVKGDNYMCLSGFEVWGALRARQELMDEALVLQLSALSMSAEVPLNCPKTGALNSFGEDGVMYLLGLAVGVEQLQRSTWVNPAQGTLARVTRSTRGGGPGECVGEASAFTGRTAEHSHTPNPDLPHDAWYSVELVCHSVCPTHYALMSYGPGGDHFIMNWDLEGSVDGEAWTTLRSHRNDCSIHEPGRIETWSIFTLSWYSHFRVIGRGPEVRGRNYMCLSGFEVWGSLKPRSGKQRNGEGIAGKRCCQM